MATLQWNSTSSCILTACYLGNGNIMKCWILAMTPAWFCPQNSALDLRNLFLFSVFYKDCFRTAVLSGGNFLMFVGAQSTENSISTTYTFHKIADYLPIIEKIHFTFLPFSFLFQASHSVIHFACVCPFSVDICIMPCWSFTKCKRICPHMADRFLLLQGAQLQGQLSGNAHHFSGSLYRRPLVWKSVSLFPSPSLQGLGRFPFWCWNLLSQTLYDESCAVKSTAQKNTCRPEINLSY